MALRISMREVSVIIPLFAQEGLGRDYKKNA